MVSQWTAQAAFFRRVLGFFRPDVPRIVLLLATIGAGTLLGLAQVWPLAILVDTVLVPGDGRLLSGRLLSPLNSSVGTQILVLASVMLVLQLLQEVLALFRTVLHVRLAHQGILRVRCDLFRKLQSLSLDFHRTQPQGDTMYRLMQDAPGCEQILTVWIDFVIAMLTLIVMLGVMCSRSI